MEMERIIALDSVLRSHFAYLRLVIFVVVVVFIFIFGRMGFQDDCFHGPRTYSGCKKTLCPSKVAPPLILPA